MHHISILRLILVSLLFILQPFESLSQSDKTGLAPVKDTVKSSTESSYHSLFTGMGYGSNMIYMGSTISRNRPFGFSTIAYSFNNQLIATLSTFHLTDIDPFLAFHNFSLSYSHVFNSWFDFTAGVYRYQVDRTLADTLFGNFTYGDVTLGIDWKLIYSKISYGEIITNDPQGYLQIKNSRYFQTSEFFKDKAFISFDPYVNFLFGTLIKTETVTGTSIVNTTQQYNSPISSETNKPGNSSSGNGSGSSYGSGQGPYAVSGPVSPVTVTVSNTSIVPTSTVNYRKSFDLIEIEFGLPVAFNLDFMTIEAEACYVIPFYSDLYLPGPKGFIFLISGFFRIF